MAKKRPAEQIAGTYGAIPHKLLDSDAFQGATHPARALLLELVRQLNGSNNGHLQLTTVWLRERGWKGADVVQRAKRNLEERKLIVRTKPGGLNSGPDFWAVTWLTISDYSGLHMKPGSHIPGDWHKFKEPENQSKRTFSRNSAVPANGIEEPITVPLEGTKTALLIDLTIPANGNNVCTNGRRTKEVKRIVGKAGKSGSKPAVGKSEIYRLTVLESDLDETKANQGAGKFADTHCA